MAALSPFRALRYDLQKAGAIEELVCPPYDIISESQREEYLKKNPNNIIRLELPRGEDPYREAGALLERWREEGILRQDMDPGLYLYQQEFATEKGEIRTVTGLLGRVRLEEFSAGVVLPHEETLSRAKQDRLDLMEATGCNFSPIYCLYQDETGSTRERILNLLKTAAPRYEFSDGAVKHRFLPVNDPQAIEALRLDFAPRKLYIADGHHRYETALNYRNRLREAGIYRPGADHVMMLLCDMADPGLVVFPTHRLVRELPGFDPQALLDACGGLFVLSPQAGRDEAEKALEKAYEEKKCAFAFFDGSSWTLLTLGDRAVMDGVLPDKSRAYRQLDVSVLHSLILERLCGIDRENMAAQKNLTYTRSAGEAENSVLSGESQCCFLLNPTRVEEIGEVASAGEKMPQKSTYFYPKPLTGFAVNLLTDAD